MAACGVCASDLHVVDGDLPEPLPLVARPRGLRRRGGGRAGRRALQRGRPRRPRARALVRRVRRAAAGAAATSASSAAAWPRQARWPTARRRSRVDGTELNHFNSVSSFAEYAVVPESVAVPIRRDVPLDTAALVGCAVLTGVGSGDVNTAGVEAGLERRRAGAAAASGSTSIQAARLAGAETIVAVDTRPEKLELAQRLGATATVEARPERRHRPALSATRPSGGPDYAFEAIGPSRDDPRGVGGGARRRHSRRRSGFLPKGTTPHDRHRGGSSPRRR